MKNNLHEEIKKKLQSLFYEFNLQELIYWESMAGSHLVKIKPSAVLDQDHYIEKEISIFNAINENYPHTELAFLPWESPIYPDGAALLSLQ